MNEESCQQTRTKLLQVAAMAMADDGGLPEPS
jgi:hypothetical protein